MKEKPVNSYSALAETIDMWMYDKWNDFRLNPMPTSDVSSAFEDRPQYPSAMKELKALGIIEPQGKKNEMILWIDPDLSPYNNPATIEAITARDNLRERMRAIVEKHVGRPCVIDSVTRDGCEAEWVAWCRARGQKLPIDDVPRLLRPTWRKVAYKFLKAGGKGLGPGAIDMTAVWLYKASVGGELREPVTLNSIAQKARDLIADVPIGTMRTEDDAAAEQKMWGWGGRPKHSLQISLREARQVLCGVRSEVNSVPQRCRVPVSDGPHASHCFEPEEEFFAEAQKLWDGKPV